MNLAIDTSGSAALAERLRRSLPGGDTRSVTFFPPYALAVDRGEGCRIWDVDGNEFVDLLNNYTALVHGHAHPAIVEALQAQAPRGTCFPAPHALQAELAERICARYESIEKLRFTNSGSEADMIALRAARAFTSREEIVKADGGYHGLWEQVPMSWSQQHGQRQSAEARGAAGAAGETWDSAVPDAVRKLVHMVDYNDVGALESILAERGEHVAAIILEPVLGEGMIAGSREFFAAARRLADEHGCLLVIDEVVTGRLALGGYQSVLGVRPDLTVLGKIIGGGLPVGAVGGSDEVMEIFDPRRPSFLAHAGTFNGNPMTTAAGCASLDLLDEPEIERINRLGGLLAEGLRAELERCGLAGGVTAVGSLVHLHFEAAAEIRVFRDVNLNSDVLARLHVAALDEGVYFAPRGLLNVSTAMDESVVEDAVERLGRAAAHVVEEPAGGERQDAASRRGALRPVPSLEPGDAAPLEVGNETR